MKNTLITRTFKNSDGIQQIAIFDTTQRPIGAELGLFIDKLGKEFIAPAHQEDVTTSKGKLVLLETNAMMLNEYCLHNT